MVSIGHSSFVIPSTFDFRHSSFPGFTQPPQVAPRVQPRVVPIRPPNLQRIISHQLHLDNCNLRIDPLHTHHPLPRNLIHAPRTHALRSQRHQAQLRLHSI